MRVYGISMLINIMELKDRLSISVMMPKMVGEKTKSLNKIDITG